MSETHETNEIIYVNPEKREEVLKQLRRLFGLNIQRVVKWGTDPPTYSIFIDDQDVSLGGVEGIMNQTHFRRAIFSTINQLPKLIHKNYWDSVVDAMAEALEVVPVALTSTLENYQRWVELYLAHRPPADGDGGGNDWDRALQVLWPVRTKEGVWVHTPSLQAFVWESQRERVGHREVAKTIKSFGGVAKRLRGRENRNMKPTYYLLPPILTPDHLMPEEIRI